MRPKIEQQGLGKVGWSLLLIGCFVAGVFIINFIFPYFFKHLFYPPRADSIWSAAGLGDLDYVERELESGVDPNAIQESTGATPLERASVHGHMDVMRRLLQAGADPDFGIAVVTAAVNNEPEAISLLISAGASPDQQDSRGWSAIHHAANRGHADVIEVLVRAGVDVDSGPKEWMAPLHMAAMTAKLEAVEKLLELGAKKDALDAAGNRPIDYANRTYPPLAREYSEIRKLLK